MSRSSKPELKYRYYFLSGTQEVRYDVGSARLTHSGAAVVGKPQSFKVVYQAGPVPIQEGGAVRFAIPLPFSVPQTDRPRAAGYCKATCSRPDVDVEISINNSPFTGFSAEDGHCGAYARSVFVRIKKGRLEEGDELTLHYSRAKVSPWSGPFDFAVFVDPDGRRRAKNSGYYVVAGFPRVFVEGRKARYFVVYLDPNLDGGNRVTAVARDDWDNYDRHFSGTRKLQPQGKTLRFRNGIATATVPAGKKTPLRVKVGRNVSNPAIPPDEYNLYWGDLHTHSLLYDGIGTPAEVYTYGRDVAKLDFQSVSEHSFYDPSMWRYVVEAANAFNEPGRFAAFIGYEARTSDFGDINFYFPGSTGPQPPPTKFNGSYNQYPLSRYIRSLGDARTLVIPHEHLKPSFDFPRKFVASAVPLVEIYSQWGNFEKPDRAFTLAGQRKVSPSQAIVNQLRAGLRFGLTGGSDNHSCHPGYGHHMRSNQSFQGGLTGVYAKHRTRRAIWDALVRRRCFATTGCRMIIRFSVSGVDMGGQRNGLPEQRVVRAVVHGQQPLKKVALVRNGKEVKSFDGDGKWDGELEWVDTAAAEKVLLDETKYTSGPFAFYYLRAEQTDGHVGWSSPVWFDA